MKVFVLLLLLIGAQHDIPFKPKDQFEIGLDFKFKQRYVSSTTVDFDKDKTVTGSMLPYLYVKVNVLKLEAEEVKVRVENNKNVSQYQRKVEAGSTINLDLGFTDDIKDRVTSHQYDIVFLSKEKKPLSHIIISFDEDGTYLVNGEKRGKI